MTEPDQRETPVTVKEAGKLFPRKISDWAVLKRIKTGIDGVKLEAEFDGYRYWVCPESVKRFIDDVSAKRSARTARLSRRVATTHERYEAAMKILESL